MPKTHTARANVDQLAGELLRVAAPAADQLCEDEQARSVEVREPKPDPVASGHSMGDLRRDVAGHSTR